MGGALDQAGAVIEKLVRQPFQRDATVRAAIAVGIQLAVLAHGKQLLTGGFKAPALAFGHFIRCT